MFKKILAIVTAVVFGAGLSLVAVAAPASAHTPSHNIGCSSAWFSGTSYEGNATANSVTFKVDDDVALVKTFGGSITQANATITYSGTTSHKVEIIVDAVGGSGPNTQYDQHYTEITTPCSYPSKDWTVQCSTIAVTWGAALGTASDISVEVITLGGNKTLSANVKTGLGGYNGLGVEYTDVNGTKTTVALTEQQVKSGQFTWNFTSYLGGTTNYKLLWAQAGTLFFNSGKNLAQALSCDWKEPVTVQDEPSVTPPTCDTNGTLVVPTQTGISWSGGANGAGPGTYTMVASATAGYVLTAPYSKPFTVLGATNDCDEPVTVMAFPSVTPPTCLEAGKLVVPTQTGVVFTGGTNGAGPGTYTIVASAADGYVLTAPYSITLTVLPADEELCTVEPSASVQPGTCVPNGEISQKPVVFFFDNTQSQLPVTFTIPSINGFSPVVVPAGGTSGAVNGPTVDHTTGGTWDVYANGDFLVTLKVLPFDQCQDDLTPGDPSSTDEKCVSGEIQYGSITIVPSAGKIEYWITGGPDNVNIPVDNANPTTTGLKAGSYVVHAQGINGWKVGPENTWTHNITIGAPEDCEKVTIPVSNMTQSACVNNVPTGYYTLPGTEFVEWWVDGSLAVNPVSVIGSKVVNVTAKITDAAKALGIVFTDGTTEHAFPPFVFVAAQNCEQPTLAFLEPSAFPTQGTCTAGPTYTLSNTTSEHGGVQWKVGDPQTNTTAGVHQASWNSKVVVEATLVDPINDGFDPLTKTDWEFTFGAKPTACGDLSTLALTGATGGFVLWIAGAMLLLGGAGIYFTRRRLAAQK